MAKTRTHIRQLVRLDTPRSLMAIGSILPVVLAAVLGAGLPANAADEPDQLPRYLELSQRSPAYFGSPEPEAAAAGEPAESEQPVGAHCPACVNPTPPTTTIPGAQGAAAAVPLRRGDEGAYVLVHQYGDVSLRAADGVRVWNRPADSLEKDWGIGPNRGPQVRTGYDAFDPFNRVSNRAYAVGELTAVPTEYVVTSHVATLGAAEHGTFITVLNAGTGETVWQRAYPGVVTQLLVEDQVLVVAHESGEPGAASDLDGKWGEPGSHSELEGWTFVGDGHGELIATKRWSHSTGAGWARWLAAEPTSGGMFAAAWTATVPGSGGGRYGHVLLIDAATGARRWSTTLANYPRLLGYEADRGRIVVAGQADPTDEWTYTLTALDETDGLRAGPSATRSGAAPFALAIGDVDGEPGSEWVTTEAAVSAADAIPESEPERATVLAVSGDSGATLWEADAHEHVAKSGVGWSVEAHPSGLALRSDGDDTVVLVATYFSGTEPYPRKRRYSGTSELRALAGATGEHVWDRAGDVLAPLAMAPYSVDGEEGVLTATGRLVANVYSLDDGSVLRSRPMLADITAVETTDVNDDGVTDLVVGGESEAVFALDGRTLGSNPSVLWVAPVEGEVHEIHALSLPDGQERLVVVAATASVVDGNRAYPIPTKSAVDVLAADTGALEFRIPTLPDYAWTATIAELTPDGIPAIVVPTSSLTAYRASDGEQLWSFDPTPADTPDPMLPPAYFSNAAVADDDTVVTQYFVNVAVNASEIGQRIRPMPNPNNHIRAAFDGATGLPLWQVPIPSPGFPQLFRGVVTGTSTADGRPGVAFRANVGQHFPPAPYQYQVDVHDVSDGALSYSALTSSGALKVLPTEGLVSVGTSSITSISADATVERDLNWSAGDAVEADTAAFGEVLVTGNQGHGFIGVFDVTPGETEVTRLADWVRGVAGGRLMVHDLDGDGSDEILHYSRDNNAELAVKNQYGLFDVSSSSGFGGNTQGIDIYSLTEAGDR